MSTGGMTQKVIQGLGKNPVSVPLRHLQISHTPGWDRTRASSMTGQ